MVFRLRTKYGREQLKDTFCSLPLVLLSCLTQTTRYCGIRTELFGQSVPVIKQHKWISLMLNLVYRACLGDSLRYCKAMEVVKEKQKVTSSTTQTTQLSATNCTCSAEKKRTQDNTEEKCQLQKNNS